MAQPQAKAPGRAKPFGDAPNEEMIQRGVVSIEASTGRFLWRYNTERKHTYLQQVQAEGQR